MLVRKNIAKAAFFAGALIAGAAAQGSSGSQSPQTSQGSQGSSESTQKMRETTSKAEEEACKDLQALETALKPIDTVTASTKVQELRNVRTQADKEIKKVKTSLDKLEDARMKELQAAYDALKKSVQKLPGDQTVGNAATSLSQDAKAVQEARERYSMPLNCSKQGSIRNK